MKFCLMILLQLIFVLNIFLSATNAQDDELKQYEKYQLAVVEIEQTIENKQFSKAEELIKKYDLEFGRKWKSQICFYSRLKLGDAYLGNGNTEKALTAYKTAVPGFGCGNCRNSQLAHRSEKIAKIYEYQLNYPAAIKTYLSVISDVGVFEFIFISPGLIKILAIFSFPLLGLIYALKKQLAFSSRVPGKERTCV